MLCLIYQDRRGFPEDRFTLYDDAIELFIKKWDAFRRIERKGGRFDRMGKLRKLSLFSKIAYPGFTQDIKKIFWRKRELQRIIRDFMSNIPGNKLSGLELDNEVHEFIRMSQSNDGLIFQQAKDIYSFVHLTFQEFFTARYINENQHLVLEEVIKNHWTDESWREVFLLVAQRLDNAERFMQIASLHIQEISNEPFLQDLLRWLSQVTKTSGVSASAWRAGFLAVDLEVDLHVSRYIEIDRLPAQKLALKLVDFDIKEERIVKRTLQCQLLLNLALLHAYAADRAHSGNESVKVIDATEFTKKYIPISEDFDAEEVLKDIIEDITYLLSETSNPKSARILESILELKQNNPSNSASPTEWGMWASKLQKLMRSQFNIGDNIELSNSQVEILRKYLYANNLLIDCIQSDIFCSKEARWKTVDNLLLPREELE